MIRELDRVVSSPGAGLYNSSGRVIRSALLAVTLLAAGCGGGSDDADAGAAPDSAVGMDAGGGCGPSSCGACAPGFSNDDMCVAGAWQCNCVPDDGGAGGVDGGPSDGGMSEAGPSDGGISDGGISDGGPSDAGLDAGSSDAGGLDTGLPDAGTSSCTIDRDCPTGHFCRDTRTAGVRECHPYTAEGGRCGGFTPPWGVERCEPGVDCVAGNPLIADAPGTCALIATEAELSRTPRRFDGHYVGVLTGWIIGPPPACTEIFCGPSMPCCNSCSSGELLADTMTASSGIELRDSGSTPYACSGDNCAPYATCTQPVGASYRVIGRYYATGAGYIEVVSIAALP